MFDNLLDSSSNPWSDALASLRLIRASYGATAVASVLGSQVHPALGVVGGVIAVIILRIGLRDWRRVMLGTAQALRTGAYTVSLAALLVAAVTVGAVATQSKAAIACFVLTVFAAGLAELLFMMSLRAVAGACGAYTTQRLATGAAVAAFVGTLIAPAIGSVLVDNSARITVVSIWAIARLLVMSVSWFAVGSFVGHLRRALANGLGGWSD